MTKRHFEALASVLSARRANMNRRHFNALVRDIADICELANPAFNREKFKQAAGYWPTADDPD